MKMYSYKYDTFPSLRLYDQLGVPYVLFNSSWGGPLWTGHCMMLSTVDGYGDEGFAHELFHYLAASPAQRKHPDFTLGRQINANMEIFTSSATKHLFDDTQTVRKVQPDHRNDGWGETTVPLPRARRQEQIAVNAMWLYPPLTGTGTWDSPPPFRSLKGAYDFAGMEYPGSDQWRTATIVKRIRPIVKAIDSTVTSAQITSYLKRLNSEATTERFS